MERSKVPCTVSMDKSGPVAWIGGRATLLRDAFVFRVGQVEADRGYPHLGSYEAGAGVIDRAEARMDDALAAAIGRAVGPLRNA